MTIIKRVIFQDSKNGIFADFIIFQERTFPPTIGTRAKWTTTTITLTRSRVRHLVYLPKMYGTSGYTRNVRAYAVCFELLEAGKTTNTKIPNNALRNDHRVVFTVPTGNRCEINILQIYRTQTRVVCKRNSRNSCKFICHIPCPYPIP